MNQIQCGCLHGPEQLKHPRHIRQGNPPQQSGYITSGTDGSAEAVQTLNLKVCRGVANRSGLSDSSLGRAEGWKRCCLLPTFSLKSNLKVIESGNLKLRYSWF